VVLKLKKVLIYFYIHLYYMYILPRGSFRYELYTKFDRSIVIGTYDYCYQVMLQIKQHVELLKNHQQYHNINIKQKIKKNVSFNDRVCICYY